MKKLPSYKKNAIFLFVLIACVLLISFACIYASRMSSQNTDLVADVYQNGILIRSIPLYLVKESQRFTVTGENGAENIIEIKPGSIAVISANCPDKICVHQGFRSDSLLPITCLPNRLVIKLRPASPSDPTSLDALTY